MSPCWGSGKVCNFFFFLARISQQQCCILLTASLPLIGWCGISMSPWLVELRGCLPAFCTVILLTPFVINMHFNVSIYLFILSWFLILRNYNTFLPLFIWSSICSTSDQREPRRLSWHVSSFSDHVLIHWHGVPDSICTFPVPGISHFSKESRFRWYLCLSVKQGARPSDEREDGQGSRGEALGVSKRSGAKSRTEAFSGWR